MDKHSIQELQNKISEVSSFIPTLKTEIGRVVVGQEDLINKMILALIANGHILLEGVPGLAKTLAVKTIAQAINGSFSRIQFTPDLLPADVIGTNIYNPKEHTFSVKKGPVFANIALADEINRAPAKVQSALLECMQEGQITIAGQTLKLPHPFLVMATQNPIEHEGTYSLPEAQVDRFMFKLNVTYPKRSEEKIIMERIAHPELDLEALSVVSLEKILEARNWVDQVYLDDKISEYILDMAIATRPDEREQLSSRQSSANLSDLDSLIQYGASPRAPIAMVLASKAAAFMDGRAYVVPQDIKNIAPDVLRHRVIVSYEAEAENMNSDDIIKKILDELLTP
ncbi:MAG TPA: MoxR family ATPase [Victivallales bacterium]|nr:MoxR family ATPase [Victivallales bacterium]